MARWLEEHLTVSLAEDEIVRLRQVFTPEVVIPAQFTVRASSDRMTREPIPRYTTAESTPYLLD